AFRTQGPQRTNLPAPPGPLIGRERELVRIAGLLVDPEVRLLALTGTGGVGKTRLALHAARGPLDNFADGVQLVRLAPVREGARLARAIAQQLGVRERPAQPLEETLGEHLREQELLLLLDNFEQLVDEAPLLGRLLERAPRLKLLVTSRVRLRI